MSFAFKRYMTALLVMTATATLLSGNAGCLVPPPIPDEPVYQNNAPRIDINKLDPHPIEGPVQMSANCTSYTFRAQIVDRDFNDTLYWRVFLDYHRDWFQESLVQEVFADPSTQGVQQVSFSVYPSDTRFFQGANALGPHTVELLLADRPFNDDNFPPGRDTFSDSDGYIDSFIWPVEIVAEDLPCEEAVP